jgi:hypothetical protein
VKILYESYFESDYPFHYQLKLLPEEKESINQTNAGTGSCLLHPEPESLVYEESHEQYRSTNEVKRRNRTTTDTERKEQ